MPDMYASRRGGWFLSRDFVPVAVVLLGLGLSTAGCAPDPVQQPRGASPQPSLATVPTPDPDGQRGTAVASTIAQSLVDMRMLRSTAEMAGIPVVFRAVDEAGQWTREADVLVDLGEHGRLRIRAVPETGEMILVFSEELLEIDPVVAGMADGRLLDVHFQFTAPVTGPGRMLE